MSDKLNINNEMRQFDLKNRSFYDELTEEERKNFSSFLMLRWGSAIQSSGHRNFSADELNYYYVQAMNQLVNKNFWGLNKHPKLQWLLLTTVSPGMGTHKHEWIAFKGKTAKNKRVKLFSELYPTMKLEEVEMLCNITSNEELAIMLKDLGWEDRKIKEAMSK